MLKFPPTIAPVCDEVGRILVTENIQGFFETILFYVAMSCQISARRISCDQILVRKEALCASVVARREVDLSKPECVFIILYRRLLARFQECDVKFIFTC